ncbi:MAG TPA: SHOCT domain-containing protein [Tepidisphaeraceae bacterium]
MVALLPILADASDVGSVVFRSIILVGLIIGAWYGVMKLRRWLQEDDEPVGAVGFTLGDLRKLHARGEITDEQFEKARAQMIEAGKNMTKGIDPLARNRPPSR